jgi:hypothetical protein
MIALKKNIFNVLCQLYFNHLGTGYPLHNEVTAKLLLHPKAGLLPTRRDGLDLLFARPLRWWG